MKLEATKKEREELKASDLEFVDQSPVEAANTGLERAKASRILEVEVE